MLIGVITGVIGIVVMCILCANYSAEAEERRIRRWEENAHKAKEKEVLDIVKPKENKVKKYYNNVMKKETGIKASNDDRDSGIPPMMIFDAGDYSDSCGSSDCSSSDSGCSGGDGGGGD
jgi:hypothetical protein